MNHRYFIGIGSNIAPEQNIPRIVGMLLDQCSRFIISPIIRTQPVGINSQREFINAVAYIETTLDNITLKVELNRIEERLGRNRQDAGKKKKDRTADIDILLELNHNTHTLNTDAIPDEVYVQPLFTILAQHLHLMDGNTPEETLETVNIRLNGTSFGHTATAIDYDTGTGNIMVLQ